jgi:adenosylmethionine-8-amino-7-oxononanoate aminotransferase
MGADCTYDLIEQLGEKLFQHTGKSHVMFASDGACAVEIALKLALQTQKIKQRPQKTAFLALKGAYHGETLGALSVTDLGKYKNAYTAIQSPCFFLEAIPYVSGISDPLWEDCESYWMLVESKLEYLKDSLAAIIVEPLVQGANGMQIYSKDFLKRLHDYAKAHDIIFIADEIMTSFGRLGEWLALDVADISADLICVAKGLTSGSLPLSAVLIDDEIYKIFYDDYENGNNFLHSHTHSGNALAVAAALATMDTLATMDVKHIVNTLNQRMLEAFQNIADETKKLHNIRSLGAIIAADLSLHQAPHRLGFKLHQEALKRGALLRPIGNTLYWLPPLNIDHSIIGKLSKITLHSIKACYQ